MEEEPSDLEKLVLGLLKKRFDTKKAKEEQTVKDKIRNEKMLTMRRQCYSVKTNTMMR